MADGNAVSGAGFGDDQAPTGNALASVSGPADAQVGLSYYYPVGNGSVVASATVNLPSGQSTLSAEEARTAFLFSQGFYRFQLTNYGQGLNVAPALMWAVPLGHRLAAGLGIAY